MVCAFLPSAFTRKAENQEYSRFSQGSDRISAGMQSNGSSEQRMQEFIWQSNGLAPRNEPKFRTPFD